MFYPRKGVLVYICVSYIFYTCNGDRLGKKMWDKIINAMRYTNDITNVD